VPECSRELLTTRLRSSSSASPILRRCRQPCLLEPRSEDECPLVGRFVASTAGGIVDWTQRNFLFASQIFMTRDIIARWTIFERTNVLSFQHAALGHEASYKDRAQIAERDDESSRRTTLACGILGARARMQRRPIRRKCDSCHGFDRRLTRFMVERARPLIWLDRAPPVTSARHVVMGFGDTLPTLAFGVSH
jgi:hypothetical protein